MATHKFGCMEPALGFLTLGLDTRPRIFGVLNSFRHMSRAHGMTRYMWQNGCFGKVFLVCQVVLTILSPHYSRNSAAASGLEDLHVFI